MPTFNVKTTKSEKVWSSPDGQRTIYALTLDYNGQPMSAKTYSSIIAEVGWEGSVETYEKPGRSGVETFVKQPPKENNWQGGGGGQKVNKPQDTYTMYLSYVKDIAVALLSTKAYTVDKLNEVATEVAAAGEMFYAMRPDANPKGDPNVSVEPKKEELDTVLEKVQEEIPWQEPA